MLDVFIPHLERVAKDKDVKFSAIEDMLYFLDMIDFEDSDPVIDDFVSHAKERHCKIKLCNDICRSQKKLELLFPISRIDRNDIADRIFNDFKDNFTIEQASAIIEKLSEENIEPLMKRIHYHCEVKEGIKYLMSVLVSSYNKGDIRKKTKRIINYIREEYGEQYINIVRDSVIKVLREFHFISGFS